MIARLLLSFDTEDFVTPESDDALLTLATELTRRGFRGCFALVGDKLRGLLERRRRDVLEALRPHEIEYHSNDHHFFPLQAPLLEKLSWEDGVRWLLEHEARGVELIEQTFGVRPRAYIKADSHWTPPTLHAYRLLGMDCYSARHFAAGDPRLYRYMNLLCFPYQSMLDRFIAVEGTPRQLFEAALADLQQRLANTPPEAPVVYGTHPCMWCCSRFYDVHNVRRRGAPPAKHKWQPAPLLPPERIRRNFRFLKLFLDEVQRLGLEVVTYGEMAAELKPAREWLTGRQLVALARHVVSGEGRQLTAAEALGALSWAVARHDHGTLPERIPLRRPLGPLETPHSPREPLPVCARALQGAAQAANRAISDSGAVPAGINIGGHHFTPAQLLLALAEGVLRVSEKQSLGSRPLQVLPDCPEEQGLLEGSRISAWSLSPNFQAPRLLEWGRLQSWSLGSI